tara:strand:- start:651 stop:1307 length:657 start_codon:yes stop_codon:yes gene_type:complete
MNDYYIKQIKEAQERKDKARLIPMTEKHLRKFKQIIKAFSLGKPYEVKIRKSGKTSLGVKNACHNNVCELVKEVGGMQVTGYWVQRGKDCDFSVMLSHSIWETPEGQWVDVTLGDRFTLDTITFFPVKRFDPTKEFYQCTLDIIVKDDIHKGIKIRECSDKPFERHPMNYIKLLKHISKNENYNFHYYEDTTQEKINSDFYLNYKKENPNPFNLNASN